MLEDVYQGPRWLPYVAALAQRATEADAGALAARLSLSGPPARAVAAARGRTEQLLALVSQPGARTSEVVALLERTEPALWLVAMAAAAPAERRRLRQSLKAGLRTAAPVAGGRLVAAGIRPGKAVGEAVRRTRAAVLDGVVRPEDAEAHAIRVARELGGAGE
jgi:hypothetical protein